VAFAIAGTTCINLATEPLGEDKQGNPVYLKNIWPSNAEIEATVEKVRSDMFRKEYADVFTGDEEWRAMKTSESMTYPWNKGSTYIQNPPFFVDLKSQPDKLKDIEKARVLAIFGDSITTDHISPAGNIKADSPAGAYLKSKGVAVKDFNSYGARRGNHEVMMRGTFANIRIQNEMVPSVEGGYTKYIPTGEVMSIYDAAMKYQASGSPLVVFAGKEYGTGSSRDWAAKGPCLLGVKAVVAESFERIHRSNLIGMGVLPLQFKLGFTRLELRIDGSEVFDILDIANLKAGKEIIMQMTRTNGEQEKIPLLCRIDTQNELEDYYHGGILQYVLRNL
jgi:aconitate hydratase